MRQFPARSAGPFIAGSGLLLAVLSLGAGAHIAGAGATDPPRTERADTGTARDSVVADTYAQVGSGTPIRVIAESAGVDSSVVPVTTADPTRGLIRRAAPVGWLVESAGLGARSGATVLVVPESRLDATADWGAVDSVTLDSQAGWRLTYRLGNAPPAGTRPVRAPGLVILSCPREVRTLRDCDPVMRAVAIGRERSPWLA